MPIFTGSAVAIVTPFTQNGLNLGVLRQLIEWHIQQGTDAIVACGTTGEPSTMTAAERDEVIKCAVNTVNGRVPVIAGTGGNNTAECIEASQRAQDMGADALLVVTPYYNKTSQHGLVAHYTAVANAVSLPIIIYNVPSRTGLNMLPATLKQLSAHPNIAGMKEASDDIKQISEMCRLTEGELTMYSGNDDQTLPIMSLGGMGVISVAANVCPNLMHRITAAFLSGDIAESRRLQFMVNPLAKALFTDVNPVPAKTALRLMGYDVGPVRMPLVDMLPETEQLLQNEMRKLNLII